MRFNLASTHWARIDIGVTRKLFAARIWEGKLFGDALERGSSRVQVQLEGFSPVGIRH